MRRARSCARRWQLCCGHSPGMHAACVRIRQHTSEYVCQECCRHSPDMRAPCVCTVVRNIDFCGSSVCTHPCMSCAFVSLEAYGKCVCVCVCVCLRAWRCSLISKMKEGVCKLHGIIHVPEAHWQTGSRALLSQLFSLVRGRCDVDSYLLHQKHENSNTFQIFSIVCEIRR